MRASLLIYGLLLSLVGFGLHPALAADRLYYIAAEEVVWDYAPSYPDNPIMGEPFSSEESVYLKQGDDRIGRRYLKAVYREYTDGSFSTLNARSPEETYLGILGPILHAEVGDTIVVHFRNNTRLSIGIHPHGVLYDKSAEGAHYSTETAMDSDGHEGHGMPETGPDVKPGGEYTYRWAVPERAGPGPSDPDSVAWLYHAHDHEGVDIYAGLIGAIIVTRAGYANPNGAPKDVDREFVTLFMILDENLSPYLDVNIQKFAGAPESVEKDNEEFKESNKKHAINGLLYGNLNGLVMHRGDRVRW
jgi:hypothetical protein